MPKKTRKEIEQIVREFYQNFTSENYEDTTSKEQELAKKVKKFTVTEEEIQMAIDSYEVLEIKQEDAIKYLDNRTRANEIVALLCKKYNIVPEVPFERIFGPFMDMSGTAEAEEKNVQLLKDCAQKENFKAFVQKRLDEAVNLDLSVLAESNPSDGVRLFFDPKTAHPLHSAFMGKDLIDKAAQLGIELSDETKNLINYNVRLVGSTISNIAKAQKALSKDGMACINPNIAAIKEIRENPVRYSSLNGIDEMDLIKDADYAFDTRPFKEQDSIFELNRLIEENNIPKTESILTGLDSGDIQSYKDSDGRQMMVQFINNELNKWERVLSQSDLKPTDSYETVRQKANILFGAVEQYGFRDVFNAPAELGKLLDAVTALKELYDKGFSPDTPEDDTKLNRLRINLSDASKKLISVLSKADLDNTFDKRQLEFADACLAFTKTEYDCSKAHSAALPHNQFSAKLKTLFKEHPEYEFNTGSAVDSLRLRSFALYKNADDNQVLEETDYLLTQYAAKNMSRPEYDKLIRSDAYELVHSQIMLAQNYGETAIRLYQNAKSCNAVLYPKNGDVTHARLLYVDKDGNPRLSEEFFNMPTLGDALAEMDAMKYNHEGYEDLPDMPNLKLNLTDEEQAQQRAINARREEMAMPRYIQMCRNCFPDAGDDVLNTLVFNALRYSAARQNFVFSSYGEVYLTDEQKKDKATVKEAEKIKETAILNKIAQNQFETEIMVEAADHPEYYYKREDSAERAKLLQAVANCKYDASPNTRSEDEQLLKDHHYYKTAELEQRLKKSNVNLSDVKFYDKDGSEIAAGKDFKPWEKFEQAAGHLENSEDVYYTVQGSDRVNKMEVFDDEIYIAVKEPGTSLRSPEDRLKCEADCRNIEALLNEMLETGKTRNDSPEYKEMVEATRNALSVARECSTGELTPKSLIAREKLDDAKAWMADAADKYYIAKVDQKMNTRRATRFAISMKARHILNPDYEQAVSSPEKLMKSAIAAKICKAEAHRVIKRNTVFVENAVEMLANRAVLNAGAESLADTPAFKAMTSKKNALPDLLAQDAGKLIKKYREKTAELNAEMEGRALH